MKSRIAIALLVPLVLAVALASFFTQRTPRTIVVVRHAERVDQSADAALSPAGEARAGQLADLLGGFGVRTIYVTEFQRTRQTAQPLAQRLGVQPVVVAAQDTAGLLKRLRQGPDPAVVVGHSNTVPGLLQELGVKEAVQIPPDEFHDLYVVVTHRIGSSTLLHLRY